MEEEDEHIEIAKKLAFKKPTIESIEIGVEQFQAERQLKLVEHFENRENLLEDFGGDNSQVNDICIRHGLESHQAYLVTCPKENHDLLSLEEIKKFYKMREEDIEMEHIVGYWNPRLAPTLEQVNKMIDSLLEHGKDEHFYKITVMELLPKTYILLDGAHRVCAWKVLCAANPELSQKLDAVVLASTMSWEQADIVATTSNNLVSKNPNWLDMLHWMIPRCPLLEKMSTTTRITFMLKCYGNFMHTPNQASQEGESEKKTIQTWLRFAKVIYYTATWPELLALANKTISQNYKGTKLTGFSLCRPILCKLPEHVPDYAQEAMREFFQSFEEKQNQKEIAYHIVHKYFILQKLSELNIPATSLKEKLVEIIKNTPASAFYYIHKNLPQTNSKGELGGPIDEDCFRIFLLMIKSPPAFNQWMQHKKIDHPGFLQLVEEWAEKRHFEKDELEDWESHVDYLISSKEWPALAKQQGHTIALLWDKNSLLLKVMAILDSLPPAPTFRTQEIRHIKMHRFGNILIDENDSDCVFTASGHPRVPFFGDDFLRIPESRIETIGLAKLKAIKAAYQKYGIWPSALSEFNMATKPFFIHLKKFHQARIRAFDNAGKDPGEAEWKKKFPGLTYNLNSRRDYEPQPAIRIESNNNKQKTNNNVDNNTSSKKTNNNNNNNKQRNPNSTNKPNTTNTSNKNKRRRKTLKARKRKRSDKHNKPNETSQEEQDQVDLQELVALSVLKKEVQVHFKPKEEILFIESAVSDEEAIWVKITEPKAVKMIRDSYDEKLSELIEKLVDEEQEENDSQNAIEEEEEEQEKEEEEEEEEEEVNQENQDEVEEANYSESSESNLESEDSQSLVNTQQSQQPRNKATRKRNHTMMLTIYFILLPSKQPKKENNQRRRNQWQRCKFEKDERKRCNRMNECMELCGFDAVTVLSVD